MGKANRNNEVKAVKKMTYAHKVTINLQPKEAKPFTEAVSKYAAAVNDGAAKELIYKSNIKSCRDYISRKQNHITELMEDDSIKEEDRLKWIRQAEEAIAAETTVLNTYINKYEEYKATNAEARKELEDLASELYPAYKKSDAEFRRAIGAFFGKYKINANDSVKLYFSKMVGFKESTARGIRKTEGVVFKRLAQGEFIRRFCKAMYTLYAEKHMLKEYNYIWNNFDNTFDLIKSEVKAAAKQKADTEESTPTEDSRNKAEESADTITEKEVK